MEGSGAPIVLFLVLSNAFGLVGVLLAFAALELFVWLFDAEGSRSRLRMRRLFAEAAAANDVLWIYETHKRLEPPRPAPLKITTAS